MAVPPWAPCHSTACEENPAPDPEPAMLPAAAPSPSADTLALLNPLGGDVGYKTVPA